MIRKINFGAFCINFHLNEVDIYHNYDELQVFVGLRKGGIPPIPVLF